MKLVTIVARGTENVLAEELSSFGVVNPHVSPGAVAFDADSEVAYRVGMGSRVASRLLVQLQEFDAIDADAVYEGARQVDWLEHISADQTFSVHCAASPSVRDNTHYLALKVKDAIVDFFRDTKGTRPNVDKDSPDLRVHLYFTGRHASLSIELMRKPLHLRGYRPPGVHAPLRETLAAAILYLVDWPKLSAEGLSLVDPMCGSGTLLVEAAWMAAGISPRILWGSRFLSGWRQHDMDAWSIVRAETKLPTGKKETLNIYGSDASADSLALCKEALRRARVDIQDLRRLPMAELTPPEGATEGIVVANPPYGDRLGSDGELLSLYQSVGDVLKQQFGGWTGHVFTGNEALGKRIGLKPSQKHDLFNGPIRCQLLSFPITARSNGNKAGPAWRKPSKQAQMFDNRLRKNLKKLKGKLPTKKWPCYRIYDRDIPEYNVAVDVYEDAACIQEFQRPLSVNASDALGRLQDASLVVSDVLGIERQNVHIKVRRKQKGRLQYERTPGEQHYRQVREDDLTFRVELEHRLDTGLFADHRLVRAELRKAAKGAKFLNLFAYTCTASVAAAAGGAAQTTSVDLSKNYLDWGRVNFELNGIDSKNHRFIYSDVMRWLRDSNDRFDLIFVNPPSYSRSKQTDGDFDLLRDQNVLLELCLQRLRPDGAIYFSTHTEGLEIACLKNVDVKELSQKTVPIDFRRSPHRCWLLKPSPAK